MATSLIFGEREDINVLHGDYFDGFTWTVNDSAGSAYTFPDGVAELRMIVYDYNGGTQIGTTINTSNGLSRASEVITWASTYAVFDSGSVTNPGDALWYKLILTTTTGSKTKTIAYGTFNVK